MCAYTYYMSTFVTHEIKTLDERIQQAQTLWNASIVNERWGKLEKISASIAVFRDLRFMLTMTKGLDVRLVVLDALVQAAKEIETKPITSFSRVRIVELSRLLQRYQWHEDRDGGIGR
jgi:hypothetical protein